MNKLLEEINKLHEENKYLMGKLDLCEYVTVFEDLGKFINEKLLKSGTFYGDANSFFEFLNVTSNNFIEIYKNNVNEINAINSFLSIYFSIAMVDYMSYTDEIDFMKIYNNALSLLQRNIIKDIKL